MEKSQAYFSFLDRTFPFPRSGLPKPRFARKGKVLSQNEKFAFDFSYSWTLTFQPYRTYILGSELGNFLGSELGNFPIRLLDLA